MPDHNHTVPDLEISKTGVPGLDAIKACIGRLLRGWGHGSIMHGSSLYISRVFVQHSIVGFFFLFVSVLSYHVICICALSLGSSSIKLMVIV